MVTVEEEVEDSQILLLKAAVLFLLVSDMETLVLSTQDKILNMQQRKEHHILQAGRILKSKHHQYTPDITQNLAMKDLCSNAFQAQVTSNLWKTRH